MMIGELQEIKEEMAQLATRMENMEGHFQDFDTTLNNHMTDYARKQSAMGREMADMKSKATWGFWVVFGLLTTVLVTAQLPTSPAAMPLPSPLNQIPTAPERLRNNHPPTMTPRG